MIDRTYGHLAPDAEDQDRDLLDAYDATPATAVGTLWALKSTLASRREPENCSFPGMEPTGIEPVTSCLQMSQGARVGLV